MNERRKGDRRIPPAVAQHMVEERGELLARIAELEAERARWERLAQTSWDKSDVEFAAGIATAIDAVEGKTQQPASQKGLAAQVLKAQDAIKQWPPELRIGLRMPDPKEWLASGEPSGVVLPDGHRERTVSCSDNGNGHQYTRTHDWRGCWWRDDAGLLHTGLECDRCGMLAAPSAKKEG